MLELERLEKSDFDRLIRWIPDERFLIQWAGPLFRWPLDKHQLEAYFDDTQGQKPKRYVFKVVNTDDGRVIGHVELGQVNHAESVGVLSRVLIGELKDRGDGLGRQMIRLAVEYGFDVIGLNRIKLGVFDFNKAAISCYEKMGFQAIEIKEKTIQCGDEYWNVIVMELRKEEYREDTKSS